MNTRARPMTQGSPIKQILLFTLPLLIGNVFQQFYNMADTFIVGRTLGVESLAAVGCTGSLVFLILGFAQGITNGFAMKTAQYCGAGNGDGVRRSFVTGLFLSLMITLALTALAAPLTGTMLVWMQTPAELLPEAASYLRIIFWGIGASMLYNQLSSAIRALGDSRTPLVFLVIACVLNIILDYVMILGFGWGVAGAGIATVVAQLVASALCFIYIYKKMPVLVHRASPRDITPAECRQHLRIGLPMGFQTSIIAIGTVVIQVTLNGLGHLAVAAYSAAGKVDQFATQPLLSMGISTGTFAAQNYGAGRIDRIRQGTLHATLVNVAYSLVAGALLIAFSQPLLSIFVGNEMEVLRLGGIYLVANGSCYAILGVLFTTRYTMQGIGMSMVPTFAGVMELVMRSAAAVLLARWFGFAGASVANPLAWLGAAVPLCFAFYFTMRRLGWQQAAQQRPFLPQPGQSRTRQTIELAPADVMERPVVVEWQENSYAGNL